MKISSIDFFGLSVTYRVEARKAGPTVFLSLRSSDGVHIDGAGRVWNHADVMRKRSVIYAATHPKAYSRGTTVRTTIRGS